MGGAEDFGLLHRPFLYPGGDCLLCVAAHRYVLSLLLVARAEGTSRNMLPLRFGCVFVE